MTQVGQCFLTLLLSLSLSPPLSVSLPSLYGKSQLFPWREESVVLTVQTDAFLLDGVIQHSVGSHWRLGYHYLKRQGGESEVERE